MKDTMKSTVCVKTRCPKNDHKKINNHNTAKERNIRKLEEKDKSRRGVPKSCFYKHLSRKTQARQNQKIENLLESIQGKIICQ